MSKHLNWSNSEPQEPQRAPVKEETEPIPVYNSEEERQDSKLWRTVIIGEQEHRINMKCIELYQKVISHGGIHTGSTLTF